MAAEAKAGQAAEFVRQRDAGPVSDDDDRAGLYQPRLGHSPRVTLPERAGDLERLRERCHGDSCFSIYERMADTSASDADPRAEAGAEEVG